MSRRKFRPLAVAGLAAAAAFTAAAPASAGVLVQSAPNCATPASSPVFSPWADPTNYFLAPDGGFEDGAAGWTLDGASVGSGNESYGVSGAGSSSLNVPSGGDATSPTVCVGLEHPTLRFFVKKNSGGLLSSLRVDALVEDNFGNVLTVPVGVTGGSSSWQPAPQMVVVANLLPLLPGAHTPVAYRFTSQGGSWQVDDFYVDPNGWKP
ncbi:MAG: hypothetical protein QOF76_2836 [Solirubrobacteraceae bacterium]|jgi:hypothetical protein|nr:hypothetical protein [Solirubrobacteraceae bacterium]